MIKSLKLFAACVESLRTAEKTYEDDPTDFNKRNVVDLRNKVDGWVKWVHDHDDAELGKKVPPFIGKLPSSRYKAALANDMIALLKKNHSDEEIERFSKMLQGE